MKSDSRRIALLCSFNADLLQRPLSEAAARVGLNVELYCTGYGLWETESLDRQSPLYGFAPEVVVIFADTADLLPPLNPAHSLPLLADSFATGETAWQRVERAIRSLLVGLPEPPAVLVHNLARPRQSTLGTLEDNSSYSAGAVIDHFNAQLRQLAGRDQRVKVIDYAGFVAMRGQTSAG